MEIDMLTTFCLQICYAYGCNVHASALISCNGFQFLIFLLGKFLIHWFLHEVNELLKACDVFLLN